VKPPTVPELRAWIGVSATAVTDDQLQEVLDAEITNQAKVCHVDDDPDTGADLRQALFRRVGRAVSAKSLPTGMVGDPTYGLSRLPSFDAEIERYERGDRIQVLA
jgi:hypothetical protein